MAEKQRKMCPSGRKDFSIQRTTEPSGLFKSVVGFRSHGFHGFHRVRVPAFHVDVGVMSDNAFIVPTWVYLPKTPSRGLH